MMQSFGNNGLEMSSQEIEELIELLKLQNKQNKQGISLVHESTKKSDRLAVLLEKAYHDANFKHLEAITDQIHWLKEEAYLKLINKVIDDEIDCKIFAKLFLLMDSEISESIYADIDKSAKINVDLASLGFKAWLNKISEKIKDLEMDSNIEQDDLKTEIVLKSTLKQLIRSRYDFG